MTITNYQEFYSLLFGGLVEVHGPLDSETVTSIVGFSVGGPVSLAKSESQNIVATCELAAYPEQVVSSEGLNYELLSIGHFELDWCRSVFTALGALGMEAELGDGHTIDISGIIEKGDRNTEVLLRLFSQMSYGGKNYGVYQVLPG